MSDFQTIQQLKRSLFGDMRGCVTGVNDVFDAEFA
jgi:hypothetical protein